MTYQTSATVSSQTTYFEYVLNLDNVGNPDRGHPRDKDSGSDVKYGSKITDPSVIWYTYDEYTTKFCMALLYAKADTGGTGSDLFTRAYGVYSSNWIGFKPSKKLLYVLTKQRVDSGGRLEVVAGH